MSGLAPFGTAGVFDATVTGTQGRDPAQWGMPQGNAQTQPAPAPEAHPVYVPGDEFSGGGAFGVTGDDPGAGVLVGVPVTGYLGPADPRWQAWQDDLTAARSGATEIPPYARHLRTPADGSPLPGSRRLQVTDDTDQYAANGTIVPTRDVWRAVERIVHNVAKTLWEPIIPYSERAFYNNIAIVAPESSQPGGVQLDGTGRLQLSAANSYASTGYALQQDPGVASAYAAPAEPAVTTTEPAGAAIAAPGADWVTYG